MHSLPIRILCVSLLLMASSVIVLAQGRISLVGRVADQTGAAIGAATVTARQLGAGFERSAKTGEDGAYRIHDLPPGDYQVSARREGFSLASQTLTIQSEKEIERKLDFILRPGQLAVDISVVSTQIAATQEEQARIPGSVEIIDARTLEISRPFNFNEALRKAPGVYTRDEEGFGLRPSIGIRGLDPNRSAKVLLLEDGVPLGHAPYGDTDAYYHPPIERYNGVEILKGSSQIVHGPNTLSGAINYITRTPQEKFSGSLTMLGGNRNYFNGYASVGATLGRTGFLFDFLRKQGEGARENMRFGIYDVLIKSATKLTEDGRQTLGFKFNYYGEDSNITYSGLTLAEFNTDPRANPFRNDFFDGDRFGGSVIYTNAINSRAVITTTIYGSDFNRDWWRQSSNSDQRPNRRGFNGCNGMAELNTFCGNEGRLRNYDALGVDPRLKISSRGGETDIGFRYHRETQNRIQQNNNTGGPNGRSGVTVEDNLRRNDAVSGYIQHRFLFGKFAVTPGLRVEHVDIERTNRLATPVTGKTDVTQVVPGFGVTYGLASRFTIFAGAHRGFSPPRPADIIDNNTGGVIELDPELSWNYEAGFRSTPARGLKLSATFFRLDYENQIVPANLSGGVGATLTSAGETLHQGFEFDWRWDSGVSFNSPHNFYTRTAYTYIGIAEYRGTRFSSVGGFNTVSIEGNRLIYSPKHLAAATLGYSHASGFDAMVEAIHTGEQFGDDLNTIEVSPNGQRGLIPAYTVWNAAVNYRIGKLERYAPTIFFALKNFADDTFIVDRRRGVMVGIPRLVQGGVKIRF